MIKAKNSKVSRGIPAKRLNFIMAGITVVISVIMLVSTILTSYGFRTLRSATEDYLAWQRSANKMQSGSDYLTEQVRFYVEKGSRLYLDNYFRESEETQSRDASLEEMKDIFSGTEAYRELYSAMRESVELMDREYYAMRLKVEALGEDVSAYPEAIRNVVLSENDAALSPSEKDRLAREMVFDEVYQQSKSEILEHTTSALEKLLDIMEEREKTAADKLNKLIINEQILIIMLITIVVVLVVLTTVQVIGPLVKAVPNIKSEKPIPIGGAYEFRFLAHTYNQMFEANSKRKKQLTYDASHDFLTGLLNRNGFEKEMQVVDIDTSALVIIDVDHFKTANDTFGHEVGDVVLKRVAKAIKDNFRSYDVISRFGGDEFAVMLLHVSDENKERIIEKIRDINKALSVTEDGSPSIAVSAGVAFGKGLDEPTLFKHADDALYAAKNNGRRGVTFYGESTNPA